MIGSLADYFLIRNTPLYNMFTARLTGYEGSSFNIYETKLCRLFVSYACKLAYLSSEFRGDAERVKAANFSFVEGGNFLIADR